ncbi:MAG: regulatory protein RecX [Clostridia bacterium]|nr:regulatory protein RecX [Clostridia bacterium]
MLISSVEPWKRSMSAVYIDGEYAVTLDNMTLIKNHIKAGVEISDEELHSLIQQSEKQRANEKALNLITYRDHSKKELKEKLSRTYSAETAEEIAEKMQESGLVNDEEYARKYADELLRKKHMSLRGIEFRLREKGISPEIIEIIKEELEFDPVSEIQQVLAKKYPTYAHDEKVKKRAIAALQRLGWSWSDIKNAIQEENSFL